MSGQGQIASTQVTRIVSTYCPRIPAQRLMALFARHCSGPAEPHEARASARASFSIVGASSLAYSKI